MYQKSLSQSWQNKLEKSNSADCETFILGRRTKREKKTPKQWCQHVDNNKKKFHWVGLFIRFPTLVVLQKNWSLSGRWKLPQTFLHQAVLQKIWGHSGVGCLERDLSHFTLPSSLFILAWWSSEDLPACLPRESSNLDFHRKSPGTWINVGSQTGFLLTLSF